LTTKNENGDISPDEIEVRELVDFIKLDQDGFSPVLPLPLPPGYLLHGFELPAPVEVRKADGTGYMLIREAIGYSQWVEAASEDEIKLMRARFIKVRTDIDRHWNRIGYMKQEQGVERFYDGKYSRLPTQPS
jgi:hypothetical protein